MKCGGQTEVGKIERIIVKHAEDAFVNQSRINAQWRDLHYSSCPDFARALEQYDRFVGLLKQSVSELHFLPRNDKVGLDSIYVRDSLIITDKGVILCNMGKDLRRNEPSAARNFLSKLGVPVLGAITGEGRLEGGDLIWFDRRTLVVGRGYRTNDEGLRQLRLLIADIVDEFIVVPLPHWLGPSGVMHLMSFISPIDRNLALVYSRIMPVPFREWLLNRGVKLIEVPDSEYPTMACNVLAVAPRRCIMLSGNRQTKRLLEDEGVDVMEYDGEEISRKGAGGPTCLTRPLLRLD